MHLFQSTVQHKSTRSQMVCCTNFCALVNPRLLNRCNSTLKIGPKNRFFSKVFFFVTFQHNPHGLSTVNLTRKLNRYRRRWVYADLDKNEALNRTEFKGLLYPQSSLVWVAEGLEDLDIQDYDNSVSLSEFLAIWPKEERERQKKYFR